MQSSYCNILLFRLWYMIPLERVTIGPRVWEQYQGSSTLKFYTTLVPLCITETHILENIKLKVRALAKLNI